MHAVCDCGHSLPSSLEVPSEAANEASGAIQLCELAFAEDLTPELRPSCLAIQAVQQAFTSSAFASQREVLCILSDYLVCQTTGKGCSLSCCLNLDKNQAQLMKHLCLQELKSPSSVHTGYLGVASPQLSYRQLLCPKTVSSRPAALRCCLRSQPVGTCLPACMLLACLALHTLPALEWHCEDWQDVYASIQALLELNSMVAPPVQVELAAEVTPTRYATSLALSHAHHPQHCYAPCPAPMSNVFQSLTTSCVSCDPVFDDPVPLPGPCAARGQLPASSNDSPRAPLPEHQVRSGSCAWRNRG